MGAGEVTFGAAMGAAGAVIVGDVVDAQPPKSSLLNKSAGMVAAGFGTGAAAGGGGGEAADGRWVKEKSRAPLGWRGAGLAGFDIGGLLGVMSKKFPPLRGGGEVTWGAEGIAFVGTADGKLKPEKAEEGDCTGGDLAVEADDEKFKPPKASARPPKESFC